MPPRVKYTKEAIVEAALNVTKKKGFAFVTAREVAKELKISVAPIFTCFANMDDLKVQVYELTKSIYKEQIMKGVQETPPFFGIWKQYMRFAKETPELYKTLFFSRPNGAIGGPIEMLKFTQDLARESIMKFYKFDAATADSLFRNLWLMSSTFSALMVTGECPYTEEEMFAIGREVLISLCKGYKEIPGLVTGNYDIGKVFSEIIDKK